MSRSAPALLCALLLLADGVRSCTNVTQLSEAVDTMLAEYERESAPARPVRVRATFDLRHAALRRDATAHVLGDLTLNWEEPRVGWNATDWGCDSVVVSSDRLWLPDMELANSAGGREEPALVARLSHLGNVSWIVRYDASVPVVVDLTKWPSDYQNVVLKFWSRAYTSEELDLEVTEVENLVIFESGEWELLSASGALEAAASPSVAVFTATLRRRAAAHRAASGAVLAAAMLLLLAAAVLPPLSRPPLCACAAFTAAIWLVTALLRLPASSTTPAALAALCVVCAAGGAAGAGAALVALVARCSTPPPRSLKSLASSVSTLCRLAPLEEAADAEGEAGAGAWAALAALLDYALLAALLLTLFVVLCIYL